MAVMPSTKQQQNKDKQSLISWTIKVPKNYFTFKTSPKIVPLLTDPLT